MFASALLQRPLFAWLAIIGLTIIAGTGLTRLRFDPSVEQFFPRDDSTVKYYDNFKILFGASDAALLVIARSETLFSPSSIEALRQITAQIADIDGVKTVQSLTTANEIQRLDDTIHIQNPFAREISQQSLHEIKHRLTQSPLFLHRFVSANATAAAIWIDVDNEDQPVAFGQTLGHIKTTLAEHQAPGLTFLLGGGPAIRHGYVNLMAEDLRRLLPIGAMIMLFLLVLALRQPLHVAIALSSVGLAMVWALGFFSLVGGTLTSVSSMVPIILLVIGLPDTVHVITSYQRQRLRADHAAAIKLGLNDVLRACLLTSCTTAVGFLALLRTDMPAVRTFGILCALGVFATLVGSVVLTPLLLRLLPAAKFRPPKPTSPGQKWLQTLSRKPRVVLAVCALLMGLLGLGIPLINRDIQMYGNLPAAHTLLAAERYADANLGGALGIEIVLDTGEPDGALQEAAMAAAQQVEAFLVGHPDVHGAQSFLQPLRAMHQAALGGAGKLPNDRPLLAQYLLLLSMADTDPTFALLDDERRYIRITARISDLHQGRFLELLSSINAQLLSLPHGITAAVTGTAPILHTVYRKVVADMSQSFALAFGVVFLIFALAFRSVRLASLSMVPNLLPMFGVLGILGWSVIPLSPSTALVFAIAFGIAVDDTLHVLVHYQQRLRAGAHPSDAISQAINATLAPIVWTSLILVFGFGALMTSTFLANAYFAFLVSCTIALALLADLVVLPAIIAILHPKRPFAP